ncbi:hypothetical protein ACE6H2_007880 [Prunus campanulata]
MQPLDSDLKASNLYAPFRFELLLKIIGVMFGQRLFQTLLFFSVAAYKFQLFISV